MPYPYAWLWVTALLVLTVPAFWPNYLGKLADVEWQLHVHGATAGLWLLLVIFQSRTIHHGRRSLHRAAGLSMFALGPLFLAGGLLVVGTMAVRPGPFTEMFGARLGLIDTVSVIAIAAFLFLALKHRRDVGLHAGWMLATVFPLINPTVGRVLPSFVPGLTIRSLEELPRFGTAVQVAQGIAIVFALVLYRRNRRHGAPMLVVAVLLLLQSVLFETVGRSAWWVGVNAQIGATSPAVLAAVGIGLGAVAIAAGWASGGSVRTASRVSV